MNTTRETPFGRQGRRPPTLRDASRYPAWARIATQRDARKATRAGRPISPANLRRMLSRRLADPVYSIA